MYDVWAREALAAGMPPDIVAEELDRLTCDNGDRGSVEDFVRDLVAQAPPPDRGTLLRSPHSWTPLDLVEHAANPPEPPTIGGLVYAGRRHVFSGEPESLKTWCAAVLTAEETARGRHVVYVDAENGAGMMRERFQALGLDDDAIRRVLHVAPCEPLADPSIVADVDRMLTDRRPSLVVLDSFDALLSLHGLDPNATVDVERFYREQVGPLQAHGAAVVLLDHVAKAKDTRGRFSIGSQRKTGAADVALGFEVVAPFGRGRTGLARIVVNKDRPGHLPRPRAAELELASDANTGRVTWTFKTPSEDREGTFRPTTLMERVSRYVEAHVPEDMPTLNQTEQAVKGKGEYVRQAVDVLVVEGYLEETAGPRGARLLASVRPYREADDEAA